MNQPTLERRVVTTDAASDHAGHVRRPSTAVSSSVSWLVDNERAYNAIVASVADARRSVSISQLAFDADCLAYGAPGTTNVRLIDVLAEAAERGVHVRILLNASLLLDTTKALRAFLAKHAPRIRVKGVSEFPQLLHAKMVIVDRTEAFLVGSPFVNGYWDDSAHQSIDARRPNRELGGRPLHDVSVRLTGSTVRDLADIFGEMWRGGARGHGVRGGQASGGDVRRGDAGDRKAPQRPRVHAAKPGGPRIARTTACRVLRGHPHGHTEILDEIRAGILAARSLIYIEHQYLSARPVVDALVEALGNAPELEVVVVLNQNPDVTAYRGWQNARLREAGLLDHPRVGLFTLWTMGRSDDDGPRAINQVFVHSKVLTVDDRWGTVGSANLDGVSLHSYGDDFSGRVCRRVFRDVRNFDVNVVVPATDRSNAIRELREALWREHLGSAGGERTTPCHGSWLLHWRDAAERNVALLHDAAAGRLPADEHGTLVLPYSLCSTPAAQLRDVGVALDPRRFDLRFNPGWLEVHASPNWVRNMFA